ncbi:hypothetical protein SAMN05421676_10248 [Salinibacillus kushneri]|uniref:Uncharacterized protein n=1 Tax=Salinibacillus kushneri TaxID=237682 RepID=A0A1I0A7B0_9BACI|nr:hypothetical protein [Salinibacillus kushneri]SES89569.1 hypothetical protein SAMN05421676_10248 [Salinibacillus kushneri]
MEKERNKSVELEVDIKKVRVLVRLAQFQFERLKLVKEYSNLLDRMKIETEIDIEEANKILSEFAHFHKEVR